MHKIICNILLCRTTKRGKMDLNSPAQDVVICELCFPPEVHLLCDSCHAYLYQSCVGDQPLFYGRVQGPYIQSSKKKPVCLRCLGSLEHNGHTISISSEVLESKIKNIQEDAEKLEHVLGPTYRCIACDVEAIMVQIERDLRGSNGRDKSACSRMVLRTGVFHRKCQNWGVANENCLDGNRQNKIRYWQNTETI